jgi:hypothetical protein
MIRYHFSKHIDVDDLNLITFGLLKKEIAARKKELATEKCEGIKLCLNTSKWVIRAEPNGHISIQIPAQLL